MREGRILCLGTGNPLTSPKSEWADHRVYQYAPPGKIITHYQGEEGIRDGDTFYPLSVKEAECDPRYGILVVEDFKIKMLKDLVLPVEDAMHNVFEDQLVAGAHRAASLVQRWSTNRPSWNSPHYGAVLMSGEVPTEDEIKRGMDGRRTYAILRLTEEKKNQMLRLQGARGMKAGWDAADLSWAAEFGFSIDIPLEQVKRPPNAPDNIEDRVGCPFCAEMILPAARKCRFCGKTFGKMTVMEYLTQPTEAEVVA